MSRNKVIVSRDLSVKDREIARVKEVSYSLINSLEEAFKVYREFDSFEMAALYYKLESAYSSVFDSVHEVLNIVEEE